MCVFVFVGACACACACANQGWDAPATKFDILCSQTIDLECSWSRFSFRSIIFWLRYLLAREYYPLNKTEYVLTHFWSTYSKANQEADRFWPPNKKKKSRSWWVTFHYLGRENCKLWQKEHYQLQASNL